MRIANILLEYARPAMAGHILTENTVRAGYPMTTYRVALKGIARAVNHGLQAAMKDGHYDAFVLMSDDIMMPKGWLASMVSYACAIPGTGIIGIHTVKDLPAVSTIPGHPNFPMHQCLTPFGNQFITRKLVDAIGGYNTGLDPYSVQDRDYGYRAQLAGFVNYYLPHLKAEHIGHDVGSGTEYRQMKDESLAAGEVTWQGFKNEYDNSGQYYLPIIEERQYYGEGETQ